MIAFQSASGHFQPVDSTIGNFHPDHPWLGHEADSFELNYLAPSEPRSQILQRKRKAEAGERTARRNLDLFRPMIGALLAALLCGRSLDAEIHLVLALEFPIL